MSRQSKIDWKEIWDEFDVWSSNRDKDETCTKCGHKERWYPDWEEQQKKIMRLVNRQLRKKRRK